MSKNKPKGGHRTTEQKSKPKTSRRSTSRAGRSEPRAPRSRRLFLIVPLAIALVGGGLWLLVPHRQAGVATAAEVKAEIIPAAGDPSSYGLPLSLDNTPRFIKAYRPRSLTPGQQAVLREALQPLKAPCCDENSMATCCCPCNLAKSVWGLSSHLIAEKGYNASQVRESALQWLHFIQSDYYVMRELEHRNVDPSIYGLSYKDACNSGLCELPFAEGGCGGMKELKT